MSIGIFDSGLGGLGAVRKLHELCPTQDLIYFGDTARLPYGTRSAAAVRRYAAQDAAFLLKKGVFAILVACGTASSAALPALGEQVNVPVLGVVEPGAKEALARTENGRVAVLGTQGTIASGAYERAMHALDASVQVTSVACPLLVPFVESGETDSDVLRTVLARYLSEPLAAGCDTLLLGCTHYPLLSEAIRALAPSMKLVSAAEAGARATARLVASVGLPEGEGKMELYTSDFSQGFETLAARFLGDVGARFAQERVAVETWN